MQVISSPAELERVARHVARGSRAARARDISREDRALQLVRRLLLDELDRYVDDRRFPLNHDFDELHPYFVDAHGTRCAVAHLMEISGEGALVAEVARTRNNARVRELADDPRVVAWLAAAGLTVEEAALIQPAYCRTVSDCVCGGTWVSTGYLVPVEGVLEGVIVGQGRAQVEATYGKTVAKMGDVVQIWGSSDSGTRVLIPVDSRVELPPAQKNMGLRAVALQSDGTYVCGDRDLAAPPLTKAQFASAVQSESCAKTLASLDPAWTKRIDCDYKGPPSGCHAGLGPAAGPTSIGLLLALVSALAWRHRRNRPA